MYKTATMMMMVCESPLHAGSGSDLDFIDKPIQRERHTGYPKIESSSLKGALRERFSAPNRQDKHLDAAFGPYEPLAGEERQGALGFTDARLLLFPVKSMKGVFAWVTCPAVLERFSMDMKRIDKAARFYLTPLENLQEGQAIVFPDSLVVINHASEKNVVLEEYAFKAITVSGGPMISSIALNKWFADKIFPPTNPDLSYWNTLLQKNLVIIPDTDFADFTELSTEVITRNQIDPKTGTVKNGHLFTEEYLPADSVLYALVMAHPEFTKNDEPKTADQVMAFFKDQLQNKHGNTFQAGGNATIGKGLIRSILV